MIHCGDPSFGGAMYGCPHCGKLKFVPFRCHSRFCPSCGNLYAMQRTTSMSFKLVNVVHRHCVFTIDQNLRDFFLQDRTLAFGAISIILTIPFCVMLSVRHFLMKWNRLSALPSKSLKLPVTVNTRKPSTSTLNPITVSPKPS